MKNIAKKGTSDEKHCKNKEKVMKNIAKARKKSDEKHCKNMEKSDENHCKSNEKK